MKSFGLLLAFAAAACAHQPPMDAPASLAAAETAFAAHSMREDMRAAFLANFADDGVFVRSGWIVSNDWLRNRPAPAIALDWRAQYVEVAHSGELGLSTGPTKITSKTDPAAAPSYGQYVSIWRREGAGPWKVAVDLGISHPEPSLWKEPLEARAAHPVVAAPGEAIAGAEARFARVASQLGARASYDAHGARDLRHYRSGHAPAKSLAVALAAGAVGNERLEWTVECVETARSGEFGYARGRYSAVGAPQAVLGWFMRVWRLERDGWRIVLDVTNPAAAK